MNKKIKEIIEALEFMGKMGDVSKIAVDNLKTGLEELDEQLTLNDVVASLPDEEMIYVSHGSDGDDDVYCAFTDLSKAEKDCEEAGTSLSTISLYRK